MNWGFLFLALTSTLLVAWLFVTIKSPRTWLSVYISLGLVLLAALNSVAPFRALLDPNYVGYRFGLLQAHKGLAVTVISGTVFLLAAITAFVAARNRAGTGMWLVAASCIIFAVINGIPWAKELLTNPERNQIQFGEYLTIPGLVASGIQAILFVLPCAVGLPWALRRTRTRAGRDEINGRARDVSPQQHLDSTQD
jgi:hypothetical protein